MTQKRDLGDLFKKMFNSPFFEELGIDKENMLDNFFSYTFPKEELINLEKRENGVDFSEFSNETLTNIFRNYIHGNGYFELGFSNQEDDMYYPTVEFYYSDYLKMGYIYLTESHNILCFDGFDEGQELYEFYCN